MVVPAGVAMAASHYVCGAAMATICDDDPGCEQYLGCGNEARTEDNQTVLEDGSEKQKSNDEKEKHESSDSNNLPMKPMSVNKDRQKSVHLFTKPAIESSATTDENDEVSIDKSTCKKTAIYHTKDGEQSVYEVRMNVGVPDLVVFFSVGD